MSVAQWIRDAIAYKGITGAELARQMTKRLGRSIDRAAVNKMMMLTATPKTKPRHVKADELIAISEITGYPPPFKAPKTGDPALDQVLPFLDSDQQKELARYADYLLKHAPDP